MRCAKLKSVTVVKLNSAVPAVWLHRKRPLRSAPEKFLGITERWGMHMSIGFINIGRNRYAASLKPWMHGVWTRAHLDIRNVTQSTMCQALIGQ
jgi:hypothetical protein